MEKALQQAVWQRARSRCEYCQLDQSMLSRALEIDHIIAKQHGGPTVSDNLALACDLCNGFKGPNLAGIDPASGQIVPLFHPRSHRWNEHFRWDGPVLVGRTPAGRATIPVLQINAGARVVLRESLINEDAFPPVD